MIRRPPRSTLFPTRRSSDLRRPGVHRRSVPVPQRHGRPRARRSEEHTSELQSHHDLVCRLLLEKKKKKIGYDGLGMFYVGAELGLITTWSYDVVRQRNKWRM